MKTTTTSAPNHGTCGCQECFAAGVPTPKRAWVVSSIETNNGGLRVSGVNLFFAPDSCDRRFGWQFSSLSDMHGYDASNATISDAALVTMCRLGTKADL